MDHRIKHALDIAKLAGTNVTLTADQLDGLVVEIEQVRDAYTFAKEQAASWRAGYDKMAAENAELRDTLETITRLRLAGVLPKDDLACRIAERALKGGKP